jgi:hypothetical protein
MTWVRIEVVNNLSPKSRASHASYQRHRRHMWTQILLPVLGAVVLCLVLTGAASRATFQGYGDSQRWAAVSAIWLVLPVAAGGVLVFAVLAAGIYAVGALTALIPDYSLRVQRVFSRIEGGTKRWAEMIRKPIRLARGVGTLLQTGFRRIRERM